MGFTVETFGNASLQVCRDGHPVLTTDPWLVGSAYFGSWALDHPLTPAQIERTRNSDFIWISHGHPDHLHPESLKLLPRGKRILLPDHYQPEIRDFLTGEGFDVTVLRYKQWFRLGEDIEVLCIDNWNQDGILIVRAGDALLVNQNDSPLFGEDAFLRRLIRRFDRQKTYLFSLCAIDADMLNIVDSQDVRVIGPPEERKPGAIWAAARLADKLGVGNYCCSSSQHVYIRADSIWANPYRIGWQDIKQHWSRPNVALHEPFVTIDLSSGHVTRNHPAQTSDFSQVTDRTDEDNWEERLTEDEWAEAARFFSRFEILRRHIDFVALTVGGETRRFELRPGLQGRARDTLRGFRFNAPRRSLMEAVQSGYFDDMLIGNFMKTELVNTSLYPHFTPLVAKLGGNAKVFSRAEWRRFWWRYVRRNPIVFGRFVIDRWAARSVDLARNLATMLGIKEPLKRIYRRLLGDPISSQ